MLGTHEEEVRRCWSFEALMSLPLRLRDGTTCCCINAMSLVHMPALRLSRKTCGLLLQILMQVLQLKGGSAMSRGGGDKSDGGIEVVVVVMKGGSSEKEGMVE